MRHPSLLPLLLATALLLPACDRQGEEPPAFLSEDAAAEFCDLRDRVIPEYQEALKLSLVERAFIALPQWMSPLSTREHGMAREMLEERAGLETLLEDYARTGNPKLATPIMRQTMLHLAVMQRKEALVRELLRQGADPNARLVFEGRELDAPLSWAVVAASIGEARPDKESAIRLIDTLAAAGADTRGEVAGTCLFMLTIASFDGAEDVYLHLLDLGALPERTFGNSTPNAHMLQLLRRGWERAYTRLYEEGRFSVTSRDGEGRSLFFYLLKDVTYNGITEEETLTPEAIAEKEKDWQQLRKSLIFLLEHGAEVNAPERSGVTPLQFIVARACRAEEKRHTANVTRLRELILLLVQHGGNLNELYPEGSRCAGKTVAEIIRTTPSLASWLEAQGISLP